MSRSPGPRSGGRIVADHLVAAGVDTFFGVPGESYLPLLDALYDLQSQVRTVTCRHEASAALMAVAHARLTGQVGVCAVTRGPGATHAAVGVHEAVQSSTPMLLLVGQVPRSQLGRGAFQELDIPGVFRAMGAWAGEADDPVRLPDLLRRALHAARAGRPGPAVLSLPEDVLAAVADVPDAPVRPPADPAPGSADLARLRDLLAAAHRPLVIAGGAGWTPAAARDLQAFAETNVLPVAASFRSPDVLDHDSPSYTGHLGFHDDPLLARRVATADLLLVLGPVLDAVTTSEWRNPPAPATRQTLVHLHPDPGELGRNYQADLAVVAGVPRAAAALRALIPVLDPPWQQWAAAARSAHLATLRPPRPPAGGVDLSAVMLRLRDRLPEDATVTWGAGNFALWVDRFARFRRYPSMAAPVSGTMGYALPAAIAAALARPGRPVVAVAGDGELLMSGQELATAVQQRVALVVLVVENGRYGTIRMHQEHAYPGRTIATELVNPDFAAWARSFGAYGETVRRTGDFDAAFERALDASCPAVLQLNVDPDRMAPGVDLSAVRAGRRRTPDVI